MLKEMLKQLAFVTGKLDSIKKDHQEINNFMSIQSYFVKCVINSTVWEFFFRK